MVRRLNAVGLLGALLIVLSVGARVAEAAPPKLLNAVSRMSHGPAGSYDITLPLTGNSGIECRDTSGGVTLVLKFDKPIIAAKAAVTAGVAKIAAAPTFALNRVTIKLSGVTDAESVTVTLTNVVDSTRAVLAS